MEAMLAVGQEQPMGRSLVEGGAMTDRGEHIEEWFVIGGGVIGSRAGDQRVGRGTSDRRAFRDQPAVCGMQVIADEERRTVAPETVPKRLRVAQRLAAITMDESADNSASRSADDRDAVVELARIHARGGGLDEQGGRRQAGPPLGEGPGGGAECRRPCRGSQRGSS